MLAAKKRHKEEIAFLKSSMENAVNEKDKSLLRTLRGERSSAKAKLNSAAAEQEQLCITPDGLQAQDNYQKTSRLLFRGHSQIFTLWGLSNKNFSQHQIPQ